MIEVEKKFIVEEKDLCKIKQMAVFVKKKSFTDTYFDTDDYRLTLKNIWLRKRDLRFELKVGIKEKRASIDQYLEIDNEEEIASRLSIPHTPSLSQSLHASGYFPFCTFSTTRETYRLNDLTIDLDTADFGDMTYRVMECEQMVEHLEDIPLAEKKIQLFLQEHNIQSTKPALGKIAVYLEKNRKDHYRVLVNAGVLRER
jgi:predicted adenylyl cyclase CyaB